MFHAHPNFGCHFSRMTLELTRSTGREYIAGVTQGGDSATGTGIRGIPPDVAAIALSFLSPERAGLPAGRAPR
jgi:hypothetical protein